MVSTFLSSPLFLRTLFNLNSLITCPSLFNQLSFLILPLGSQVHTHIKLNKGQRATRKVLFPGVKKSFFENDLVILCKEVKQYVDRKTKQLRQNFMMKDEKLHGLKNPVSSLFNLSSSHNQISFQSQLPAHSPHSLNFLHCLMKVLFESGSPALAPQPLPPHPWPFVKALHLLVVPDLVITDEKFQPFKTCPEIGLRVDLDGAAKAGMGFDRALGARFEMAFLESTPENICQHIGSADGGVGRPWGHHHAAGDVALFGPFFIGLFHCSER